jgi:hypothetical protein
LYLIETISDVLLLCSVEGGRRITPKDTAAESILDRLSDLENYPEQTLVPYEEFEIGRKTYYFTPGGFLYRKAPGPKRLGASSVAFSPTRLGAIGQPRRAKPITRLYRPGSYLGRPAQRKPEYSP